MANYKEIKGISIQTTDTDPEVYAGSWAAGGTMNNARYGLAGCGIQTAGLAFGGATPVKNETETYNGTAWTEVANLNLARASLAGAGTNTAGLAFGGLVPPAAGGGEKDETETFNGSSWTEVNDLNTGRLGLSGAGITTAALAMGGNTPHTVNVAVVESWDGTSWTEVNDLNTARKFKGVATQGTPAAALVYSGDAGGSNTAITESYNGSTWTEVNDVNTARSRGGGAGTQGAALFFGGDPDAAEIWEQEDKT